MKKITLQKFDVLSLSKIIGLLYAFFGFIGGAILTIIGTIASGDLGSEFAFFGGFAIIGLPLMYGVLGFIAGAISAFIFNLIAPAAGGLTFFITDDEVPNPKT